MERYKRERDENQKKIDNFVKDRANKEKDTKEVRERMERYKRERDENDKKVDNRAKIRKNLQNFLKKCNENLKLVM